MPTVPIEPAERSPRFRVPSVGVLIVFAVMLLLGAALITWWTARSGIRRIEVIGGGFVADGNQFSDTVTDFISIDPKHLWIDNGVTLVVVDGPAVDDRFLTVLHRFPNLREIMIEESAITDKALAELATISTVTELILLDSPAISDQGIAELAKLPDLGVLVTSNLPITGESVAALMQLEALNIERCDSLTSQAIRGISQLSNLKYLSFADSPVTDEDLQSVVLAPMLEHLTLDATNVTDASLLMIVNVFPNLKALWLQSLTEITNEGLRELVGLKKLQSLNVLNSNISEETALFIQEALPGCEVFYENE